MVLFTIQAGSTGVDIEDLPEKGEAKIELQVFNSLHNFFSASTFQLDSAPKETDNSTEIEKPLVTYIGQGFMALDTNEKKLIWDTGKTQDENLAELARQDMDRRLEEEFKEITGVGFLEALEEEHHSSSLLDEIKTHKVRSGESLWTIASKYNINIDTLIGANDINDMNRVMPGDELEILPVKGILYNISPGDSFADIVRKFELDKEEVKEANDISEAEELKSGDKIILPGAEPEFGYQDRLNELLTRPVEGRVSSPFGPRWGTHHDGKDYAVPVGTPVEAAAGGRVTHVGRSGGYGKTVIIQHQNGLETLYAHLNSYNVRSGQQVNRGQVIAYTGNTGRSTGPHLHFEVRVNGRPVDPVNYLH